MKDIGQPRVSAGVGPANDHPTQPTRVAANLGAVIGVLVALLALVSCSSNDDPLADIRALQENGKFDQTIAPLRELLDENPSDTEASLLLGTALMRTGDSSSAIWPLRRAIENPEYVIEAGLMLARAQLKSRTPRDVVEAADIVLNVDPTNIDALVIRAQGKIKGGQKVDGLADLDRALELDPDFLEAHVPRVSVLIELELIEDAEKALVRAQELFETTDEIVRDKTKGRICIANALFAYEKGEVERATTLYEECLEKLPDTQLVVSKVVEHFDALKQTERATEVLRNAMEGSDSPYYRHALARRMGKLGRRDEQEELLRAEAAERPTPQAWFTLADFLVLQERFAEAATIFEKSIEADENPSPMTRLAYVDTLIQAERFEDAKRNMGTVDEGMRDLLEGRLLLETGDPEGALVRFEHGLRLWPDNPTARFLAGRAAEQIGDFDRAIEEYREAIRKRKGTGETDAAWYLARIIFDKGAPHAAYTPLSRYVASHPRHKEALLLLIKVGDATERPKVIVQGMTRLVNSGRAGLGMSVQIGLLANENGAQAAIDGAERSGLDMTKPESALALRALVEQLQVLERHDEAREKVAAALELHPDTAAFHNLTALVIRGSGGDIKKARAEYERALELRSENPPALVGLAELAALAGENDDAIALYDRAFAANPTDDAPASAAVALLQSADQAEQREQRLAAMVVKNPRDAFAANALATSLAQRGGDLDRALSYAKRAAYFTTVDEAPETLGWVYLLRGEHASAVEVLTGAVDARPDATSARFRLGLALAAQGESTRAREAFEAVISAGGGESDQARSEIARIDGAAGE